MHSLEPLFSIIPVYQKESKTINGTISPVHWDRFQDYARRIRVLHLPELPKISNFAFIQVSQLLKGQPLLPCLGSIWADFESWQSLLITPTLHSVSPATDRSFEGRDSLGAFLHGLIAVAPKLCKLDLTIGLFSPSHMQTIAQLVSLQSLRLMFNPPDVCALRDIFTVQNITELTLELYDASPDMLARSPARKPSIALTDELLSFGKLQSLTLEFEFLYLLLEEGDLRRMAVSWPDMHRLQIMANPPVYLSMTALEIIALHWPSMRELALPLDLRALSEPRYITFHQLRTLNVSHSVSFDDPVLLAKNLDSLFPLQGLLFPEANYDIWAQVARVLDSFRHVKKAHEWRLRNVK